MKLPFTKTSVEKELCGRTLVYAIMTKALGIESVRKVKEFELSGDGNGWRIDKGRLLLTDDRLSLTDTINGLEVINDQVLMVGESHHLATNRLMVYERSSLGTNFRIVISSHINFEAHTVGRAVKSLLRAGIPEDAITVVVGGCEEDGEITEEKGYKRLGIKADMYGCTGLIPIMDGRLDIAADYVLLMHDTCEATVDFEYRMKQIDIGAPYDFVPCYKEIGLWSTKFLKSLLDGGFDLASQRPPIIFENIADRCILVRTPSEMADLKAKDVYGNGQPRAVKENPEFGIKKYLGSNASTMKP